MPRPTHEPIGLELTRTSKILGRAFDDTLASVGGSLATWLVRPRAALPAGTHG